MSNGLESSTDPDKPFEELLYKPDRLSFIEAPESGVDVNVISRMSEDSRYGIKQFLKKR